VLGLVGMYGKFMAMCVR